MRLQVEPLVLKFYGSFMLQGWVKLAFTSSGGTFSTTLWSSTTFMKFGTSIMVTFS